MRARSLPESSAGAEATEASSPLAGRFAAASRVRLDPGRPVRITAGVGGSITAGMAGSTTIGTKAFTSRHGKDGIPAAITAPTRASTTTGATARALSSTGRDSAFGGRRTASRSVFTRTKAEVALPSARRVRRRGVPPGRHLSQRDGPPSSSSAHPSSATRTASASRARRSSCSISSGSTAARSGAPWALVARSAESSSTSDSDPRLRSRVSPHRRRAG